MPDTAGKQPAYGRQRTTNQEEDVVKDCLGTGVRTKFTCTKKTKRIRPRTRMPPPELQIVFFLEELASSKGQDEPMSYQSSAVHQLCNEPSKQTSRIVCYHNIEALTTFQNFSGQLGLPRYHLSCVSPAPAPRPEPGLRPPGPGTRHTDPDRLGWWFRVQGLWLCRV